MTLSPEEYIQWIDKHLRGELTDQEKVVFERMLKEEEGFASKVEELKEIHAGIRLSVLEEKYALMEEWDDQLVGDEGLGNLIPEAEKNNLLLLWLGAAALFVLAIIFLWPMNDLERIKPKAEFEYLFDDPQTFNKIVNPFNLESSNENENLSEKQIEAYKLFSTQRFYDAIPRLQDLWISNEDSTALYYLGYSYLKTEKKTQGLNILLKRFEDSNTYYIDDRLSEE